MTLRFLAALLFSTSLFAQTPFVAPDFPVPASYQAKDFQLLPLGPDLTKQDYEAYMSSIEHLQKTFGGGRWPTKDITLADARKDTEGEAARFKDRKSFTYAAISPDGSKEYGCVYIRPSRKEGYDATVTIWVTKEQFDKGFEDELLAAARKFLSEKWPFRKVAYIGKEISQADFRALPDKK